MKDINLHKSQNIEDFIEDLSLPAGYYDLKRLSSKIRDYKKNFSSNDSSYEKGYLCALSVVEGMIAEEILSSFEGRKSDSNTRCVVSGEGETHWYSCESCGSCVDEQDRFCRHCGLRIV